MTELKPRNLKVNKARIWRLRYEFRDYQGRAHAQTVDVPESDAELWKVGDTGRVLYDPANPRDAIWLGRDEAALSE